MAKKEGEITRSAGSPTARQKGGKTSPMRTPNPVIQMARSRKTRVVRRGIERSEVAGVDAATTMAVRSWPGYHAMVRSSPVRNGPWVGLGRRPRRVVGGRGGCLAAPRAATS